MKRYLCLFLSFLMIICIFAGCKNNTDPTEPTKDTSITEPTEENTEPSGGRYIYDYNIQTADLTMDTDVSQFVTLGEYENIEYTPVDWEVTEEEVEEALRTAFPTYPEVLEGVVKDGDTVNVTFNGYVDGKLDEHNTSTDLYQIIIGSHQMMDGFEEGLIGAEIGDTVELNLTFPDPFKHEDYAGKDIRFEVTIHSAIGEAEYPEMTDEVVKEKTGGQYETVEDYKKYLRESLEAYEKAAADSEDSYAIIDAIIENAEFKSLPTDEIEYYNTITLDDMQAFALMVGMSLDEFVEGNFDVTVAEFPEYNKEEAEYYVKKKLVLVAIAQAEGFTISDEDFDARLKAEMERLEATGAYAFEDFTDFKDHYIEYRYGLDRYRMDYILADLEADLIARYQN